MLALMKKLAAVSALAIVLMIAVAGAAQADDWRGHEVAARHWHHAHPGPVYTDVYSPPVIVTPPPVYAEPAAPSFNLVLPLNFH